jgi:DNA-binding beta-propeller fold protein YncE
MMFHRTELWVRLLAAFSLLLASLAARGEGAAQTGSRTFPETGKTVSGKFLAYWNAHGGLAQQGYPISEEMQETSDTDGRTYTVQYFERAIFEDHPENDPPYDVLLSLLGTFVYKEKYPGGRASGVVAQPDPDCRIFSETRQAVCGTFLDYWTQHGGLAQQGYPISDEFTETSDLNGKPYTVQYFERAVFERHPENLPPYDVLLSQLGTLRYKAKNPSAGRIAATIALPGVPQKIALGGGFVWVAALDGKGGGNLVRVDRESGRIVGDPQTIGFEPHNVSFGEGGVWVSQQDKVARFDPSTGNLVATIPITVKSNYVPVLAAEGSVWVADPAEEVSAVMRIDPATNQVVGQPVKVGQEPLFIVAGGGFIWVGSHDSKSISRIDPRTSQVTATVNPGFEVHGLAYDEGSLWVANYHGHAVVRVEPTSGQVAGSPIPVGYSFEAISAGRDIVWTAPDRFANDARRGSDIVTRIDAQTARVYGVLHAGGAPTDVEVGDGEVWVTTTRPDALLRVAP